MFIKDLRGKTCFITGGASGIGLALALAFGEAGMNIVIADIEEDATELATALLASRQLSVHSVRCDVSDRASVTAAADAAVAAYGKVHLVCNNAGVAPSGLIGQVTPSDWDWIIDVNLKGVVHGVEVFTPLILSHGEGGHFVNTASVAALSATAGLEPYCATKAAVAAMSEGWCEQLAPLGIGVSVLCPGFVRTRIMAYERNRPARYRESLLAVASDQPNDELGDTFGQAVSSGLDPQVVGQRALEGVRAGELYIFTDPRFINAAERRFELIRAGFDAARRSETLQAVVSWAPLPAFA